MDKAYMISLDLSTKTEEEPKRKSSKEIIEDFNQIFSICRKNQVDRIIVALDERRGRLPLEQLLFCRLKGIRVDDGLDFSEHLVGKIAVENLYPSSLIFSNGFKGAALYKRIKRAIDIIFSVIGFIIFSPLFLIIPLAIKLDSRGPAFYRQDRVGEDGKIFELFKFRSMWADAEKDGPAWAAEKDPRITRVGKIIRKLRFDEIPQIVNVLRGEMSFVGPRPERPFFVEKLKREIPFYSHRHAIKPGITGWAQLYYPYGASKEDALEKLKYDLYYIKNMSPFLDLTIILETIKVVLFGRGSR